MNIDEELLKKLKTIYNYINDILYPTINYNSNIDIMKQEALEDIHNNAFIIKEILDSIGDFDEN